MPNPLVHFEIMARGDRTKSQQFYSELFEWHVDPSDEMNYGMVDTHTEGGFGGGISGDGAYSGVAVYVPVDDLQKFLDIAEKLGGKTVMPPFEVPGVVKMAMFSDPEGNVIGMVEG